MNRYNNQDQVLQLQEQINSQSEKLQEDLKTINYEPNFRSIQSKKMLIYDQEEEQKPKELVQKKSELRIVNTKSIQRLKLNNFIQNKEPQQDTKNNKNKKRRIKVAESPQNEFEFNPQVQKKKQKKEQVQLFTKIQRSQSKNKNLKQNLQEQEIVQQEQISSLTNLNNIQQDNLIKKEQWSYSSELKMVPSSSSKKFLTKINQQMFDANIVKKNTMFNEKIQENDEYLIAKRKQTLQNLANQSKTQKHKKQLIKLAPLKNEQKVQVMRRINKQIKAQNEKKIHEEAELEQKTKEIPKKHKVKITYQEIIQQSLKKFCQETIKNGKYVQCKLKRDKSGMNMFFPQYNVFLDEGEDKFLICAKKNFGSYSISVNIQRFDSNSEGYLGYIEGNFTGSVYNIFQQKSEQNFKQIIATIIYDSDIVLGPQYRRIQVYIKNQNLRYNELDGVDVITSANKNLCQLYNEFQTNKNLGKIIKLITKQPTYDSRTKSYGLDFKGKIKKSSVKNMILINVQRPDKDVMIFGKTDDNDFYLKINCPMSMLIAMGILMSSFDFKLASQ